MTTYSKPKARPGSLLSIGLTYESVGDAGVPLRCAGHVHGDSAEVERSHDIEALEAAAHGAQHGRRVVDDEAAVAAVPGGGRRLLKKLRYYARLILWTQSFFVLLTHYRDRLKGDP